MYFTANSGATRDEWLHSGIVVEVDSDGYATKISSKMGEYDVIEHHPRDIPEQYGSSAPTFTINGRNTHLEFIGEKNNPEIMKKILQIFLCLFLFQVANSQEANRNEVHHKFRRLAYLRGQYEGYNKLYEKNQQSVNLKT